MGAGADGPREAARVDGRFDHARAEEVAGALGQDDAIDGARFVAHATGEITQPEAKGVALEVAAGRTEQQRFEFPDARVLPARKTEVRCV